MNYFWIYEGFGPNGEDDLDLFVIEKGRDKDDPPACPSSDELQACRKALEDEFDKIVQENGIQTRQFSVIILNKDTKKLERILLEKGWIKQYIPFGP